MRQWLPVIGIDNVPCKELWVWPSVICLFCRLPWIYLGFLRVSRNFIMLPLSSAIVIHKSHLSYLVWHFIVRQPRCPYEELCRASFNFNIMFLFNRGTWLHENDAISPPRSRAVCRCQHWMLFNIHILKVILCTDFNF